MTRKYTIRYESSGGYISLTHKDYTPSLNEVDKASKARSLTEWYSRFLKRERRLAILPEFNGMSKTVMWKLDGRGFTLQLGVTYW
jgi:hypothetical protein